MATHSAADAPPLRGTSMHDGVAARLRAMVFDRELGPGELIDEAALAARWQISRTPLREALKVLAAEGLVEAVPRQGSRVVTLTDADAEQLFPVMAMLEGRCAHEATLALGAGGQEGGEEPRARLRHLHEALERHAAAGDIDGYYRANHDFHAAVQALADNRWLDRVTGDLRRFMRLWRGRQLQLPGRLQASINEHRVLLDAMLLGDARRAERAMHDHLTAQLAALQALRRLEQASAPPDPDTAPHDHA
ncbi:MAG: GntR family transcriptional regulator [Burkholderiaceae bacterium]|nr:GntR family transcriptional regulator [Burkholderiaceae bacterium]